MAHAAAVPPMAHLHAEAGLDARQRDFALAILDPERAIPAGLVGPDGMPSARRFAVYRNNVVAGLIEALKAAFPATCRIVGEDFFAAMARIYVAYEPPASPVMLDYGAGFPSFVGGFAPAAALPYLGDVARLERAWAEAYHAAEAKPVNPSALADVDPARLPALRLLLHPSLRIVRSRYPMVRIWQMNTAGGVPAPVALDAGAEDALVMRPAAEVEVRALQPGTAVFTEALMAGAPVLDALTRALASDHRFDLCRALAGLLEADAIIGWEPPHDRPGRNP